MISIPHNLKFSTFSALAVAGLGFAASMTYPFSDLPVQPNNRIYQSESDTPIYSSIKSVVTGEYSQTIKNANVSLIPSEVEAFLLDAQIPLNSLHDLLAALRANYGNVQIDATLHVDPEEDWIKPIFTVHSGVEDFDELLALEEDFFAKAAKNPSLMSIIPNVVVLQA